MNTVKYVVLVSVFQGSSHLMICLLEWDDKMFYWSIRWRRFEEFEEGLKKSPWRTERKLTRKKDFWAGTLIWSGHGVPDTMWSCKVLLSVNRQPKWSKVGGLQEVNKEGAETQAAERLKWQTMESKLDREGGENMVELIRRKWKN